MDVSIKDIDEISHFGSSVKNFLSEYLMCLSSVGNRAGSDRSKAMNTLTTMRNRVESAERDLRSAERMLEDAERSARNSEADLSDKVDYVQRMVDDRLAKYELAKSALEEAEGLVRNIMSRTEMVQDEVRRGHSQLRSVGSEALQVISKSLAHISQYLSH